MPGSHASGAVRPALPSLALRTLVVAVVVLGAGHQIVRPLARITMPLYRELIEAIEPDLMIESMGVTDLDGHRVLRFTANLSAPIDYAGHTIYPFGWNRSREGWYEIKYSLDGALLYASLLLISILAWPARSIREMGARLLIALLFLGFLLVIDVPTTVVAEFWNIVTHQVDPRTVGGWMVWSRFLMGGGGLAIAGACGFFAIALAGRITAPCLRWPEDLKQETGYARFVTPKDSS